MRHRHHHHSPWSRLVFGATVLTVGIIFWLDRIGRIEARDYFVYWPLVLIAIGIAQLLQRQWVAAIIWVGIGVVFLADVRPWLIFGAWPLLISVAGINLIVQAFRPRAPGQDFQSVAVMGANSRTIGSQSFSGGSAVAVMAGCEIDLSTAQPAPSREALIDVLAFWGGVEIRVPKGWRVDGRVAAILGGFEDSTEPAPPDAPRLVVRGSAIMGGIEVRNG